MIPPGYGLVKTTLLDFPGLVAAVVFLPGCNLRCPWCQNPGLVQAPWAELVPEDDVFEFLARRKGVLRGVVVTGGEPLVHPRLPALLDSIRGMGYQLKLDTNGTFPDRLAALAPGRVDYVAFDLKNAPSAYPRSAGVAVSSERLRATLDWLEEHHPDSSEVRLTWVPGLNDPGDLDEYAATVGSRLPVWVQGYRPGPVLDPRFASVRAPTPEELAAVVNGLQARGVRAQARS